MRSITLRRRQASLLIVLASTLVSANSFTSSSLAHAQTSAPSWTFTGSLNVARANHTANLLSNGKVLVVGGQTFDGTFEAVASAELYDPVTGVWSNTNSLNAPRSFHTATLLPNGNVLVTGGLSTQTTLSPVNTSELYDVSTGTWRSTSNLNVARASHTATLLGNGKVLVVGGLGMSAAGTVSTAEIYDPATETWTTAGDHWMLQRYLHSATLLLNGNLLIAGGCGDDECDSPLQSAALYNASTASWSATGNANAMRETHTATLLPDGKVLVAGGGRQFANLDTNELYDPATGTWGLTDSLTRHTNHTATLLPNGKVLVAGGEIFDGSFHIAKSAELYDPATGHWSSTTSLNEARSYHSATLLRNGKVLVVGGWNGNTAFRSAELYDSASVSTPNPIDDPAFFVRQHYLDFLNREPDPAGLAFWTNEITSCGADQQCIEVKRINVSAAFFLSIEFQHSGYLVYRMYKTAYGDTPTMPVPLTRQELQADRDYIGQSVVVGESGWEQVLENNKNTYVSDFVGRSRFTTSYPEVMTAEQFVDRLNTNSGGVLSQTDRDQLVGQLVSGTKTRGQVLRSVAENSTLAHNEFNKAFVLMQYFGYLRRNPHDLPDTSFAGYDFWLNKLNQFNGNFLSAEMVKAFITSTEYRQRFGSN